MSTRRERLERKRAKRQQWADSRTAEAERRLRTARTMADGIPFGQPILIGHHSEKRDRNYRGRIQSNFEKSFEASNMAAHHTSKAAGLEAQLDRSIYSDDSDAIEQLQARIAEREAERSKMALINKLYRKKDAAGLAELGLNYDKLRTACLALPTYRSQVPYEAYELSNLGGRIQADKKRLVAIQARQQLAAKAGQTETGVLIEHQPNWNGWCRVTFAEKPEREILNALREAGFRWGAGHWAGYFEKLPQAVAELTETTGRKRP